MSLEQNLEQIEQNKFDGGNTKTPSKKQDTQSKYWCFTYNNYCVEQIEQIEQIFKHESLWYVFQEEIGENNTPHLQGTICLKVKQRLTQLKKINNKIHWEQTKCVKSSVVYCTKKESRAGKIYSHGIDIPKEVKTHEPYGWQLKVMEIIKKEPDERTIHWFHEPKGGIGKTTLCKYLCVKHGAIMLTGKSNDMYHQLSKMKDINLVIVDIPRSSKDYINYGAIEQIKNGLIFSGKYEGKQLIFDCPHVICFANETPNFEKMSNDRWNVIDIEKEMYDINNSNH